jgi:hypothetical protein
MTSLRDEQRVFTPWCFTRFESRGKRHTDIWRADAVEYDVDICAESVGFGPCNNNTVLQARGW